MAIEALEKRRLLTATGTWSVFNTNISTGAEEGVVLTNGSIMIRGSDYEGDWYKLTPSASGNYAAGTVTTLATEPTGRLYTATEVLQSGNVFDLGGEYTTAGELSNTGDIYNPNTNSWSQIATFPNGDFGDDPSELLPNGQIITGYIFSAATYIYNPTTNAWTTGGTKLSNDRSDEEGWVTLSDHSILSYDVFASSATTAMAQRYYPATNTWVATGNLPAELSSSNVGYELGPGLLLPDGRVLFVGGTAASAYYTPSTNTWAAGPTFSVNGTSYVASDAPGAVLPDGDVLLAMSPLGGLSGGGYTFPGPSAVFELNPTTNAITNVTPGLTNLSSFSVNNNAYTETFTVLPSGQVMMFNDGQTVAIYTEGSPPVAAATPVITGISFNGATGVYTLSGTNLNGINEGAAYGDDNEMSSNYPLVRLNSASGVVSYATTTNWSLTGVNNGAETVSFTLPAADTAGGYLIQAVANGVPSATALAVFADAGTGTPIATLQTDSNALDVDVLAGTINKATFPVSAFSTIYIVGDNAVDTLSVRLSNNASIPTYVQAGTGINTININQTASTGPVVILPSTGNNAVNVGTVGDGTAIAQFLTSQQIGRLNIGPGGLAQLPPESSRTVLQATAIFTTGSGILDLSNNDVIVHNGVLSVLTGELASGYNQGVWTGAGIQSTTAAADTTHRTALGILSNTNSLGNAIYTSFEGVTTVATDVLIKYTYYGDADLNGVVNGSDYSRVDAAYFADQAIPATALGWSNGDFNYNGLIDGSDYTLIDNTFNTQAAVITAQVAAQVASPSSTVSTSLAKVKGRPSGTAVWGSLLGNGTTIMFPHLAGQRIVDLLQRKDVLDRLT